MVYSIIQKSQLEGAKRLDAEYYQPEYFIDFSKGEWRPIGDFLEMCQYGISQAMNDKKIGHPIFKMNDINNAFIFDDGVRYVDVSENIFKQFKLDKNDVLFNRVNSEEFVGRTGIFKLDMEAVFASYLIRLKLKNHSDILPDYLNIFLNSNFGLKQIKKFRRRAVNQANVNADELQQINIAILPLNIQSKIEKLSNESWRNFEASKFLHFQAEDLFLDELKINKLNLENQLSYLVNLSDSGEEKRWDADYFQPKYTILLEHLKKKCKAVTLGDLVNIKKGIEPGADEYFDEGKPFIRVSNLSKNGIDDNDQKYLREKLYKELKEDYEPKKGEILLTKDASPGVAYYIKEDIEGIISGGVLRLKLKNNDIEPEYLTLCLNSIVGQMQAERDSGGSVIAHWKPEQIKNVLIPILPRKIQEKIADLVYQSFDARGRAEYLLDEAKRKVEEIIEQGNE